jgi:adenine specific DNA methylase Mod
MAQTNKFEKQFLNALRDIFVGAKVEGDSGYVNLMRIKSRYYEQGVFPQLQKDITAALQPFPDFREELFDKLYTFFQRYFSESGSIYFRYTALHQNVYEKVYTDDRDVILFWKTHMLYYVKTDRIFTSLNVEVEGVKFFFDASKMTLKKSNEKREVVYSFRKVQPEDGTLVFDVAYSEKGKTTRADDILKDIKKANVKLDDETLNKAFRVFEKQSEVDFFINKDARAFLQEQFDLWMYQYLFAGQNVWSTERLAQLQVLKAIAFKVIDFISQFEDELVKIWNKPKFVLNSHYVLTLDHIFHSDPKPVIASAASPASSVIASPAGAKQSSTEEEEIASGTERPRNDILARLLAHPNLPQQVQEWRDLGMIGADFKLEMLTQKDLDGAPLHPQYQHLPIDTKYFSDLELDILALFDDLDAALDGWLVHSENYQALTSIGQKYYRRMKGIYIDPPYNTGKDEFVYLDTFRHSSWQSMMNNRLLQTVDFMDDRGAIFVSVDEIECSKLEENMRSVFNPENYIATYIWEGGRKNDSRLTSISHEYIIGFAKDLPLLNKEKISWQIRKPGIDDIYKKAQSLKRELNDDFYQISKRLSQWFDGLPDNHPAKRQRQYWAVDKRGVYFPSDIGWHGGNGPRYEVIHPITGQPCKIPERGWMYPDQKRMAEAIGENLVHFWEDHTKVPSSKAYLKDNEFEVLNSVFYQDRRGPTKRLRDMFGRASTGRDVFENPKDEKIISRYFKAIGDVNDLFMDFFAGSGTTAHAVMNLNRADGGKRKYILVEMGEHFNTVILPRIKKVAFSDQWKDGKASAGQGMSHFVKYYDLEQYEDVLRRAHYADADLFHNPYEDPYHSYVFLRDLKMLDSVEIDEEQNKAHFHPERLYTDPAKPSGTSIDLAETLSQRRGKWIKRITAEYVEFQDGERMSLTDPDWQTIKPLVWWQ